MGVQPHDETEPSSGRRAVWVPLRSVWKRAGERGDPRGSQKIKKELKNLLLPDRHGCSKVHADELARSEVFSEGSCQVQ